jgi:hypothetical protein
MSLSFVFRALATLLKRRISRKAISPIMAAGTTVPIRAGEIVGIMLFASI